MKLTKEVILFYVAILILILGHGWEGALGKLGVLFILGTYAYFFYHNVTYAFLLVIIVLANPGRMYSTTPFGLEVKFLYFMDIFFYLAFITLLSPQFKNPFAVSKRLYRMLMYMVIFTAYQIAVGIAYTQNVASPFSLVKLLEEYKLYIFAIFVSIPVYKVFMVDPKLFIRSFVIVSIMYTIGFLLSIYTSLQIVEVSTEMRIRGSGIARMMIQNAELFKIVIFMAVVAFFVSDIKKYVPIFVSALLSLAVLVVSMYRLELTYTILTILLVMLFSYRLLKSEPSRIVLLMFAAGFTMLVVFFLLPTAWTGLTESVVLAFKELGGETTQGVTETRSIIELPHQLAIIKKHPFIGIGFHPRWWQNYTNRNDWGLTDIPFTGTLAKYGAVGMLIYYSRFVRIFIDSIKSIKYVGMFKHILLEDYKLEIFMLFSLVGYFFSMIFFRMFYVSWELTMGYLQSMFGAFIGLFYAIDHMLREKVRTNQLEKSDA